MGTEPAITIGIYHERPDGIIVRSYGVGRGRVHWYDDNGNRGSVTYAEYWTWKHRRDLTDFPNAKDPLLPYVFDLFWDIKHLSELKRALANPYFDDIDALKSEVEGQPLVKEML